VKLPRSSGVQLHPTSLPSGRLGADAFAFVDWLADAGQTWWQVLPLNPPDEHRSPYKAHSAFACSRDLLAEPDAPVSTAEERAFAEREGGWVRDWAAYAGDGAVADQVRFDREWGALRTYARERGVRIIGDVPIYVAPGSADHLAHPELFRDGLVAGVPPDAYSDEGQLWGNPLYDWPANRRRGYRWWIDRLRRNTSLFDLIRIDHFRGFVAYWAVPEDATTAREGAWKRGPGRAPFDAARTALGRLPFIAEDLGVITPAVDRLRAALGLPGMVVTQFGFGGDDPESVHRIENHSADRVAYTGTHDADTLRGWYGSLERDVRAEVDETLAARGLDGGEPWDGLIRLTFSSPARLAMLQLQDVLGLGSEGRMNVPGREGGNWGWQLSDGQLTAGHAHRLRAVTEEAKRLPRR
jgi:4-alpha-glucanotransferase